MTSEQKAKIQQVVNVFETGSPVGRYDLLVVMNDGRNRSPQITYGRSQTTEQGNLKALVRMYVNRNGAFSHQLTPYLPLIGVQPLHHDSIFKRLLVEAGQSDPVMRQAQDDFFDQYYYVPALGFFTHNQFTMPLSLLVIYDSYVHSGQVRMDLRTRFPERVPAQGGAEMKWVEQYVDVRHQWLLHHSNSLLHRTVYRTRCFKEQIQRNNWDLSLPVRSNGVLVP